MNWLIRLYPRGWRDRYGAEFAQLLEDLPDTGRVRLAIGLGRGALDAHLHGRFGMKRWLADGSARRGGYDGLIVAGLLAVLVVLTSVVFPGDPQESDSDPEYLAQYLLTLAALAALFVAIGVRAGHRSAESFAGAKAGAVAGAVIAASVTLTFITVNNLFLHIVSRQHDKRVAFASSGWSSMRAYLTVTQLEGALVLIPVLALVGGLLGQLGGMAFRARVRHPAG